MDASKPASVLMTVAGVALHPTHEVPTVLLRGDRDPRIVLPIAIGSAEAAAIALGLTSTRLPRPMTHDLVFNLVTTLKHRVERVEITRLDEGVFYAQVALVREDGQREYIDARPSDGIAMAVRFKAPVYVHEAVLAEAGSLAADDDEIVAEEASTGSRPLPPSFGAEVSLEDLDPELFGKWES